MANKTKNYGLEQPLPEEFYDIGVQNANMEKIDTTLKAVDARSAGVKDTPADEDGFALVDSADGNKIKLTTWGKIKTALGKVFAAIKHLHPMEDINGLVAALSNKANDLGRLTQEIFDDATYPHPYMGSAIDLVGQPSAGQYRIIYIPYFANTEGYAVQIAIGAVGNDGLHWRKSHGPNWQPWNDAPTAADLAGKADAMVGLESGDISQLVWLKSTGFVATPNVTGAPKSAWWIGSAETTGAIFRVDITNVHYPIESYRRTYQNGSWTDWVLLATATPPQEYDLPLAAGITAVVRCKYRSNQEREVTTNLRCSFTAGLIGGQSLATLPPSYRPADIVTATCNIVLTNGSAVTGQIDIRPDGDIAVYPNASVSGSGSVIMSPVSFVAV